MPASEIFVERPTPAASRLVAGYGQAHSACPTTAGLRPSLRRSNDLRHQGRGGGQDCLPDKLELSCMGQE